MTSWHVRDEGSFAWLLQTSEEPLGESRYIRLAAATHRHEKPAADVAALQWRRFFARRNRSTRGAMYTTLLL